MRSGAISGQITGSGGLTINSGTGTGGALTVSNSGNNYSGGTTINSATLVNDLGGSTGLTGSISPFGSGLITVNSAAQLQLGSDPGTHNETEFDYANAVSINGGTVYENDGVQHIKGSVTVGVSGGTLGSTYNAGAADSNKGLFLDGVVSGSGNLNLRQSAISTGNNYNTSIVYFANNGNSLPGHDHCVVYGHRKWRRQSYSALRSNALANATVNLSGNNASNALVFGASPLVFNTGLGSATPAP